MTITKHKGFLVVLQCNSNNPKNPRYSGVDRIPAYPSSVAIENSALDDYVFGNYKSLASNLIDQYAAAQDLLQRLDISPRQFEIIGWCRESSIGRFESELPTIIQPTVLGSDVAAISGDYWSIVEDISSSPWANAYAVALNEYGLLPNERLAIQYLRDYRKHAEADWDQAFEVGSVIGLTSLSNCTF